ncbi:MAG: TlpA disulfide reductase family protein, partial [Armatimonadota bacterium]|nr:TlpA disulfide reductase family protein [Armatimonadota bacterium]
MRTPWHTVLAGAAAVACCGLLTVLVAAASLGVGTALGQMALAAVGVGVLLYVVISTARRSLRVTRSHMQGGAGTGRLLAAGAAVAVALSLYLLAPRVWQPTPAPPVPIVTSGTVVPAGESLPPFQLPALGGGAISAADLQGRPAVINFFASWCPSCWAEIPHLARAYADYRAQGLQVLGIGVLDSEGSLRWMAGRLQIPYPAAYDEKGGVVVSILRLRSMPTTLFVDRRGVIRARWEGVLDEQT